MIPPMIFHNVAAALVTGQVAEQVVIVMKSNHFRSLRFDSNNRDPVIAEIVAAPGIQRGGVIAALSILQQFGGNTNALAAASATGDGGVALEFEGETGRSVDVVVPDEGRPCYFVARSESDRSTGVINDPTDVLPLCEWLECGGSAPGKPLSPRI